MHGIEQLVETGFEYRKIHLQSLRFQFQFRSYLKQLKLFDGQLLLRWFCYAEKSLNTQIMNLQKSFTASCFAARGLGRFAASWPLTAVLFSVTVKGKQRSYNNLEKIVFLDIDGPLIPGHLGDSYTIPWISLARSKFDISAIQRLNQLCEQTGARIVTNSMQNYIEIKLSDLRNDLINWGVEPKHFHRDWRTVFPDVDYTADPNPRRGWGRWLGIKDWQERNGVVDWICYDDRHWTDDERLILIDFEQGITHSDYERGLSMLSR